MSAPVCIRPATPADLESLVSLHLDFRDSLQKASPTAEQFRTALQSVLSLPDVHLHLAFVGDSAVGYTAQRFLTTAWSSRPEALVEDLYVRADHRGRGIGRKLIEAVIAEAKAHGCGSMFLDTNERNEASSTLYRTLGFTCERARWNGGRQIRHDLRLA